VNPKKVLVAGAILYLVERNHYWVTFKTYPLTGILALPVATFLRYVEQARAMLASKGAGQQFAVSSSKVDFIKALVRGIVDALKMLPKMRAKLRAFAEIRRLGDSELRQLLRTYCLSFRKLVEAR
jgi:hypothetical protein